jgi:hypothetical protein
MIASHISLILYIIGALTSSMLLLFFLARLVLDKVANIRMNDETGLFFVRHWGVMAFCMGVLLIWAGVNEAIRTPIILMAMLEKAIIAGMIIFHWGRPIGKALRPAAIIDIVSCILFVLYFLGI